MYRFSFLLSVSLFVLVSCGKKTTPSKSAKVIYKEEAPMAKPETKKEVVRRRAPEFPKTIYVNDAAAKKSVDGRLYYDVKGHRYWKNYRDGKYYLFDKSMYSNPDFKPPGGQG